MAMWVVQAHREGRWAAWGPQGLDLVIQRSGMGTVPGCTRAGLPMVAGVGRISVRCKTRLQVPDSRVRAWSQQSCLRRDKIQYFGKVLQNSPLAAHKMQLNRAILTMILPCR